MDLTTIVKHYDPEGGGHANAVGFNIKNPQTLYNFFNTIKTEEWQALPGPEKMVEN